MDVGKRRILEKSIQYRFENVKLLETALTHSSAVNEVGEKAAEQGLEHNERLEFLGDAVLELCVSEELYRRFSGAREGDLTRLRSALVSGKALARVAKDLQLPEHLKLGRGEENQGGRKRPALLADAVEALFGAVFMDGGFKAARDCIRTVFKDRWPCELERTSGHKKDNKSRLQELTQERYKDRPVYSLVGSEGPEHEKVFRVALRLPNGDYLEATGASVKRAEQNAAGEALCRLGGEPPSDFS